MGVLSLFLYVALCVSTATGNSISSCASLGYEPSLLDCRMCHKIAAAIPSASASAQVQAKIQQDCLGCCSPAIELRSAKLYDNAELICNANLFGMGLYGGTKEFLEKSAARYSSLKVSDRASSGSEPPKLVLTTDDDAPPLTVSIDNWKIEAIELFLNKKVNGAAEDAKAKPRS